jgi:ABC-type antimicrobial peptide transport system permease subunit
VIISQSVAERLFPGQDPINRHIMWTDPVMDFISVSKGPRRIVGVAADVDDEHVIPGRALTIYHPFGQVPDNLSDNGVSIFGGRLFVHTRMDPYALVTPITRIVREMSVDQPIEHAATLEDIRAEVLTPDRLNSVVFGGFAAVALAIAIVGVGGVLAFSVSARTREFGIRLAIGSQPRHLLTGVIAEGAVMAGAGVLAGAAFGFVLARLAGKVFVGARMPSALPVIVSAVLLMAVAVVASVLPAARAARVDVMQALRSE